MDYEKKYNEALERVRRLHDRMQVLSSTDALVASSELEFIFPELAESEDERIRKELIEAFEAYDIESKWNGIPIRSIFAWLEKQKEQKPADCIEDSVKFEEGFKAGRESGLRDGQKYVLNNLDSYGLCKSAEWSEEDEKKITFLERLIRYNVPEGEYGWVDGHKSGFITKSEAISKLKSLRPSWKPSEEQMEALNALNCHGDLSYIGQQNQLISLYNDLKKLI